MAPKSQHAFMVAAVAVGVAAVAGIAAIEGWLTLPGTTTEPPAPMPRPRITATPAESLLPGEAIVEAPVASPPAPPPASLPASPSASPSPSRPRCPNCGEVASTTYRQFDRSGAWEVRIRFDDGTRGTLRYPTDPGFRVGDRVVMANGRLKRS